VLGTIGIESWISDLRRFTTLKDFLADRRDWFPGGRGAKSDIYHQAYNRPVPDLGRCTYFFGAGGAMIRRVYSVSTFSKKTP
jgi:hypothetical protein